MQETKIREFLTYLIIFLWEFLLFMICFGLPPSCFPVQCAEAAGPISRENKQVDDSSSNCGYSVESFSSNFFDESWSGL